MLRAIGRRLGIDDKFDDPELAEFIRETPVEKVARDLRATLDDEVPQST